MIIGLAGKKRVGKSSVAEQLVGHGFEPVSFATPLKDMAAVLLGHLGMTRSEIVSASLNKEEVIPKVGVRYRVLLQTLGTEWGRNLQPDLWLFCADHRLGQLGGRNVVFDDVRFENESQFIRDRGGLIIHLIRKTDLVDDHASESGLAFRPGDALVGNNGSLEGLFNRVYLAMEARFGEAL